MILVRGCGGILSAAFLLTTACFQLNNGQVNNGSTNIVHHNIELSPIVTVSTGDVRGKVLLSRNGEKYYAFLGLPYATPPINNGRFRPPSAPLPWQGVKNATSYGPKCVQYDETTKSVVGDEDCLYLNLFVPKLHLKATVTKLITAPTEDDEDKPLLPVLVFLNGGNFMQNDAADYGAEYFMDEAVILVTLSYRLGAFGFLNTGNKESQGNAGLKDQVLALKYVKENINKFGGDSNKVVIFGQNAGAASVHYHLFSPLSKQLFAGAISQSGNALSPTAYTRFPRREARRLGAMLNCPNSDMLELSFCLQGKEAADIARAQISLSEWNNHPVSPFGPSVETTFDEFDKFLTEPPYQLIQKKRESEAPWILGVNENEGLYEAETVLLNPQLRAELNVDWNRIAPASFYFRDTAMEIDAVSNQIRAHYFGSAEISNETATQLSNLYSDRYIYHGTRNSALLHAKINEGKPVYIYLFGHQGRHSRLNLLGIGNKFGPTNGDELQYLFKMKEFPEIQKLNPGASFSTKFVRLWVQFAETLSVEKTWGQRDTPWKQVSPGEVLGNTGLRYYKIDTQPSVVEEPFAVRMSFWDTLPLREYNEDNLYRNDLDNLDDDQPFH